METPRKLSLIYSCVLVIASMCTVGGCEESSDDGGSKSDGVTASSGMVCNSNTNYPCTCPGGVDGTRFCNPDGTGFGACQCPQSEDTRDAEKTVETSSAGGTIGTGGMDDTVGKADTGGMGGEGEPGRTAGTNGTGHTGGTNSTSGTGGIGNIDGTGGTGNTDGKGGTGGTSGTGGTAGGTADSGTSGTAGTADITMQVLLFMRAGSNDLDFMLEKEVLVMKATLERSGFNVVIATLDGSDFSEGDITVNTDIKLADAKVADYAGFILPCMMVPSYPEPEVSEEAIKLVQEFIAAGKPVAAQTGSLWTLAKAGVLKGKEYAYPLAERSPLFEGAIYSGTGVVRDGLVLTSGLCPHMARTLNTNDGTEELSLALAEAMKENM